MFKSYATVTLGILSLLFSCNREKEEKNYHMAKPYFDLKTYFSQEASRLQQLSPTVSKTVTINGSQEHKILKIKNWAQEFSVFSNADINKTAWIGKFKVITADSSVTYLAEDDKVAIKKVIIGRANSKIKEITIISTNRNLVFTTTDTLVYIPDVLYTINKHQKIKLIKAKEYKIKTEFKTP